MNVTARIDHGRTFLTPTRYAIRWARTRVLPEPAPARIRSGPSVVVTARACSGFSRPTISFARAGRSRLRARRPAASSRARRSSAVSSAGRSPGDRGVAQPVGLVRAACRSRVSGSVRDVRPVLARGVVGAGGRRVAGGSGTHRVHCRSRPFAGPHPAGHLPRRAARRPAFGSPPRPSARWCTRCSTQPDSVAGGRKRGRLVHRVTRTRPDSPPRRPSRGRPAVRWCTARTRGGQWESKRPGSWTRASLRGAGGRTRYG